jgi:acetylornithine deacetylase/succinyl-diaminopimelate desuccinylase-like protein
VTPSIGSNIVASRAELKVDCRVPPGLGEAEVRAGIAEVLGSEQDGAFSIEFTERMAGNRSPIASPLMDAISGWISEQDPGADVVPVILPGFTDSRHFREAFPECVAYGFFPQRHQTLLQTAPLIHSADERIDVRDLAFATEFFRDLAVRMLG